MLSRRRVVTGMGLACAFPRCLQAQGVRSAAVSFDELLKQALDHIDLLAKGRANREGWATEYDVFAEKGVAPRYAPSAIKLTDDAVDMIIAFEVTSQQYYQQHYQGPTWPRGESGVTIGIGYDVGYVTSEWLAEDWKNILSAGDISTLSRSCGIHGSDAQSVIGSLKSINIPWSDALRQFLTLCLPRYTAEVTAILPNASSLPLNCLGALVSLDYNRGPSFKAIGDRYKEMRAIRLHMVDRNYELIPDELRSMGRLWQGNPNLAGLVIRRNLEAALFEKGLKDG